MSNLKVLLFILSTALSLSVLAQTTDTKEKKETKAEKTVENGETKTTDEADEVITNRRLRAASGSLSKWSGQVSFNYNAGSVEKPFAAQRPNLSAGANNLTLANMNANLGFRYRMNPLNSLTFAAGAFMSTPFNNSIKTNDAALKARFKKTKQVLTVNDPNIIYTNLANYKGFQFVNQLTPTYTTNSQQRNQGYTGNLDWTTTIMKDVGSTGLSLGGALEFTTYFFDKTDKTLGQHYWQVYPVAEYVINDTFNLRTVLGYQWEQLRETKSTTFRKLDVFQSVGLGTTLTRDIFLYPNIQYLPSNASLKNTNVGLSAYINI
ncbi:MAG: hypothetical protein K2P81_00815 [Bacteriovoracaceae bacterium]|nr:hypothetical protein [Bacteriovoracaceae bacterium]